MKFLNLAELLSKLEITKKRLEMIDLLSNFFNKMKIDNDFEDIEKIVYLLQGMLVSNIKQFPKLGLAEKMIIDALSLHSGINKKKIQDVLIKKGDIGAAAEVILSKNKKQKSLFDFDDGTKESKPSLEISEMYSSLQKIALTDGAGSQDSKLGILRGLMRKISPLETKYLLRIITSTLRVGVSSMTIIDGIALGLTGEKKNREIIERAYNLHPDLGDVTRILAEKGIEELRAIDIKYGTPVQSMLASRVPYKEIINKLGSPCIAEYKLDGERIQVHKQNNQIQLFSRRLLDISDQYPDVCEYIIENINAQNVIIEGEVVAMNSSYKIMLPFQVLSKRRRKYDIEDMTKDVPVCLFLFDLLKFEEQSYIEEPLLVRRKKLEEIVKERKELKLVKSVKVDTTEQLLDFFNEARKDGTEGIIGKSMSTESVYQAGNRGFLWIKMKGIEGAKLADTIDCVIVGGNYGRGRRGGVFGTYIVAVYDPENDKFEAFTRVSSGWTDEIIDTLMIDMKKYEINNKNFTAHYGVVNISIESHRNRPDTG